MQRSRLEHSQPLHNVEGNIYAESIRLVYAATPAAAAAIVIAVGFLTYLFSDVLPRQLYFGWFAYMMTVAAGRLVLYQRFRNRKNNHENPIWARLAVVSAALTGIGWGACSLLFFKSLTFPEQEVLILVVVAYTAGSITTMFPVAVAFAALLLPAVVPLIFHIYSLGTSLAVSIGTMLVFFLFFVTVAAGRLRKLLTRSLQLRFENEALAENLKTEKDKSEQLNDSLRQEVEERKKAAESLIIARREAEQANMAKTQFLANMSHDIRTPMHGIIGMTRMALETDLSPAQQKYLDNIRVSADGLLGLLNDILDFSKIEARQLLIVRQNFNFRKLLGELQSTLTYNSREKGVQLNFPDNYNDLPTFVIGDELRLRQVLINLIGNAIKFTHHGSITLSIAQKQKDANTIVLHFQIRDTGIGIARSKQQTIFTSFSQADSSMTRKYGGSGLGLAISKQLVEMMGGTLWLESVEGVGSTFHFTTVLKPGRQEDTLVAAVATKPVRPLSILLADDYPINCDLAQLILEKDGHNLATVSDGMAALVALSEQEFELIFMDVQMPNMDGLTAAQIIRQSEEGHDLQQYDLPEELAKRLAERCHGRHIPIIAMTANAMEEDRRKCMVAGMDGYLTKPFDPLQIRRVIADFFGC